MSSALPIYTSFVFTVGNEIFPVIRRGAFKGLGAGSFVVHFHVPPVMRCASPGFLTAHETAGKNSSRE